MDNTYFYCPCFYFPKHNGWDCTIAATKHWHGVLEKDALLPEYNAHKIMHNAGQRNSKGRRRRIYQRRLKIQHNTKDANSKCGLWKFWLRCKFTFSNVISRNCYSQYLHLSSRLQGDSADSEYQKKETMYHEKFRNIVRPPCYSILTLCLHLFVIYFGDCLRNLQARIFVE